jgi:hypothetical protein
MCQILHEWGAGNRYYEPGTPRGNVCPPIPTSGPTVITTVYQLPAMMGPTSGWIWYNRLYNDSFIFILLLYLYFILYACEYRLEKEGKGGSSLA